MAALPNLPDHAGRAEIVDLRQVPARDLEPLLSDEIREWRHELDWDFAPSASLVRQFAGTNSLGGAALVINGEIVGYGYAVMEEPRGIIGDIYVRPHRREPRYEAELFRSLLDALATTPRIARMESQLMLCRAETASLIRHETQARGRSLRLFERRLMSRESGSPLPAPNAATTRRFRLEPWNDRLLHTASAIISGAYKGETDSEINAQYRSPGGARRFLSNIVEFPGCGNFHAASSFMAFDASTGDPAGMVLSSFVASHTGHISQLCVMPEARGFGLGGALLRASIAHLCAGGASQVSLTVTASNQLAISLYSKFGFTDRRTFFAFIWDA